MSTYYGVPSTPNDSFLQHYGVKGMKWGVRRARESSDSRQLHKQHTKAVKKYIKLSEKANLGIQQRKLDNYNKSSKYAVRKGANAGAAGLTLGYLGLLGKLGAGSGVPLSVPLSNPVFYQSLMAAPAAGAIAGTAGSYAAKKIRQQIYKNRLKPVGHAKAVAKRDSWKREMDNAFKGTRYQGRYELMNKKLTKGSRRNDIKKDIKNGLKAAALSTVMGPSAAMYVNSRQIARDAQPIKRKNKRRR